jgi:hypothetical protein
MIIYGLTMQGKNDLVPKEVAKWLVERNSRYHKIDFEVNCWEPYPSEKEKLESTARKYSRIYGFNAPLEGVGTVSFLYLSQSWIVKIIGGLDKKGEIADKNDPNYLDNFGGPLPVPLRAEIVALPDLSTLKKIEDKTMGILRKKNEPVLNVPDEMVSLPPDFRMTSELSISGADFEPFVEFAPLLQEEDPDIREEALRLYYKKDWESLRRLKEQYE